MKTCSFSKKNSVLAEPLMNLATMRDFSGHLLSRQLVSLTQLSMREKEGTNRSKSMQSLTLRMHWSTFKESSGVSANHTYLKNIQLICQRRCWAGSTRRSCSSMHLFCMSAESLGTAMIKERYWQRPSSPWLCSFYCSVSQGFMTWQVKLTSTLCRYSLGSLTHSCYRASFP